jgi:sugar phosphate permease
VLSARRWVVWGLSALFVVYNYFQQVLPGIVGPDLLREFHLGAGELGNIAAPFFVAYALLQIPVGFTLDRFGPHRPLAAAVVVAALGSLLFSASTGAGTAALARLVIGSGAAFSFIASLKLVSNWFAPERFATLAGLTNTAGMIGAAGGGAPLALLVAGIGWRGSLGLLGGVGLALALLIVLFVRDQPPVSSAPTPGDGTSTLPVPVTAAGWRAGAVSVVASPQVWLNALYATAISIVFVAFGALWGISYIEKACGVPRFAAAAAASLLFLGAIPGSMFFGWFSDRTRRRKAPMLAAAVGGLACMCALLYLPGLSFTGLRLLLAALGFFCSANIVSYAVSHDISRPAQAGLALGLLNTCFYAGGAISQPLVGKLLDLRSAPRGAAGIESLTAGDFRFALSSVVAALLVSLVAALLLEESHPKAGETDATVSVTAVGGGAPG